MSFRNRATGLAASIALIGAGILGGFALVSASTASVGVAQETTPTSMRAAASMPAMIPQGQFVTVAEEIGPKVVFIEAERPRERPSNQRFQRFFDEFFGGPPDEDVTPSDPDAPQFEDFAQSQGSGVIISPDGLVLTNAHVVAAFNPNTGEEDRATRVTVTMHNEESYEAEILGVDLGTDLALLKIEGSDLPFARMGDSDEIRVGEWVMAVGAPFGLQNTVSAGIVSALGRAQLGGAITTQYQDYIQTDAAINPGNSGGPLVNLNGDIVGINTAIATSGGQAAFAGVGFAVPANLAREIMEQLRANGRVIRGYLGVTVQPLGRQQREAMGLDASMRGAIVATVADGGPADAGGLEPTDIVIGMNGDRLESQQDFLQRIARRQPGDTVSLAVLRGGETIEVEVTLTQRPDEAEILASQYRLGQPDAGEDEREDQAESSALRSLGLRVTELTSRLRQQLRIDPEIEGVVVSGVLPNSPAARAGLDDGDVIMRVRQQQVGSVDEFLSEMEAFGPGDAVAFFIYDRSANTNAFIPLRIPR